MKSSQVAKLELGFFFCNLLLIFDYTLIIQLMV
nr:MAG TPA: hypothetical protein [Caudoviricetes sp.]